MRVEVLLGNDGDCLMTFASPGERAWTMKKTGTKQKDENRETSGFQVSTSVIAFISPRFYSVELAETNLHFSAMVINADLRFGVKCKFFKTPFTAD